MKLIYFTRHEWRGASSRYRSLQYFDHLRSDGFEIEHVPFFSDAYLEKRAQSRKPVVEVLQSYLKRIVATIGKPGSANAIVVEKEMFPFLPALTDRWVKRRRVPVIYDYDDAIWHAYERRRLGPFGAVFGKKIARIVAQADHVVVGNQYLEDQVRAWGAQRVTQIPTTVLASRYQGQGLVADKTVEIVWIGSQSTGQYLLPYFPVLAQLYAETGAKLRAIGLSRALINGPVPDWLTLEPWCSQTQIEQIASARIGIMPVPDEPFERGKCGFKLVQYMGAGLPVVASPVGANSTIIRHESTGFLAKTPQDWHRHLTTLIRDPELAAAMGNRGRHRYLGRYSTEAAAPRWSALLRAEIQKSIL